jgi:hypothetical protein
MQDNWEGGTIWIGAHILFTPDGPWALYGPPMLSCSLTIVGSCAALNSAGGACTLDARGLVESILIVSGPSADVHVRNVRLAGTSATGAGGGAVQVEQVRMLLHWGRVLTRRGLLHEPARGSQQACAGLLGGSTMLALVPWCMQGAHTAFADCRFESNAASSGAGVRVKGAGSMAGGDPRVFV